MTLPDERYRSILVARALLCAVSIIPHSPTRAQWADTAKSAQQLLRHYPRIAELDSLASWMPRLLADKMDPLYELCVIHEQNSIELTNFGGFVNVYHRTSPTERYHAIRNTTGWLIDFTTDTYWSGSRAWKVSVEKANDLLEHFPTDHDLDAMALDAPHMIAKTLDPLHRMCLVHAQSGLNGVKIQTQRVKDSFKD